MKKIIISLLLFVSSLCTYAKGFELQPYSGFLYSDKWGLQTGSDIGFLLKNNFYFQAGLMFYSNPKPVYSSTNWKIGVNLPVYMQYRLPISDRLKMNVNVGPYFGISSVGQIGVASKIGFDISKVNLSFCYFQNCITDKFAVLGLSVGYKFVF